MLIVPEIQTVVLLVPRTGSRSLKNALLEKYPQAFLLYRHMEADGVPQGYDRWRRVGIVRKPVDRLWSLYKYLKDFGIAWAVDHDTAYTTAMRKSVEVPFEEWLLHNELVFTSPYDSRGNGRFYPAYCCRHPLPENRKSQFMYLRPDLGTKVVRYEDADHLFHDLSISPVALNKTERTQMPELSPVALDYVQKWFAWDFAASERKGAA